MSQSELTASFIELVLFIFQGPSNAAAAIVTSDTAAAAVTSNAAAVAPTNARAKIHKLRGIGPPKRTSRDMGNTSSLNASIFRE